MVGEDITRKLQAWLKGDAAVVDELLPFLVANLRALARRIPKSGETLNTTALVNETWLRLAQAKIEPKDREHFLAVVARAMRQILIDHARAQLRVKRGGGAVRATLEDDAALTEPQIEQLLLIEELLEKLERENPRRCRVFEMRFFGGFAVDELAGILHVSENTVIRDYRLACAWLRFHLAISPASNGVRP